MKKIHLQDCIIVLELSCQTVASPTRDIQHAGATYDVVHNDSTKDRTQKIGQGEDRTDDA
jgi:hypothetical protein